MLERWKTRVSLNQQHRNHGIGSGRRLVAVAVADSLGRIFVTHTHIATADEAVTFYVLSVSIVIANEYGRRDVVW